MSQDWNPESYAKNARFVSDYGLEVVDLLGPKPGERVLDLGCGDGALTEEISSRGATVVGVDNSPEMVRTAVARGTDARLLGGEDLPFDKEFDAVFSNAALHWMSTDPGLVVERVFRSLKVGGRFVGEFGGHGNVAAITIAIRSAMLLHGVDCGDYSPWYFPTPAEYHHLLTSKGFKVNSIALTPRPTPLPTGMQAWLQTFAGPFLAKCEEVHVPQVLQTAVALMRPSLRDTCGIWTADYVRIRFSATKGP